MRPSSHLRLLRENAAFRRVWGGKLISFAGDWFTTIALYEAIGSITNHASAVALVLLVTDLLRALGAVGLVVSYSVRSLAGLYGCTIFMTCRAWRRFCAGIVRPTVALGRWQQRPE